MVGKWGSRPVKPIGRNVVMEAQPSPWSSMERRSRLYVNVVWVNVSITARGRLGLDSPAHTDTRRDRQRQRTHGGTDKDKDNRHT